MVRNWHKATRDERISAVRQCLVNGMTAEQLRDELKRNGMTVLPSKNMIVGFIWRLRVKHGVNITLSGSGRRSVRKAQSASTAARQQTAAVSLHKGKLPIVPVKKPADAVLPSVEGVGVKGVPFLSYKIYRQCNHPLWEGSVRGVDTETLMVCGDPCAPGRTVCEHHRIAYIRRGERKQYDAREFQV